MPVIGAVLTLSREPALRARALDSIAGEPRVTPGAIHGDRLPVVLESEDRGEDRDCWARVTGLPGVTMAELAYADFSDLHTDTDLNSRAVP